MHTHRKTLITIAVVLCLMPFIAVPYAWKGWIAAFCGALILITVLMHVGKKSQ